MHGVTMKTDNGSLYISQTCCSKPS